MRPRTLALWLCTLAAGCASAAKPRAVDLQPARQALEARGRRAPPRRRRSPTRAPPTSCARPRRWWPPRGDASQAAVKAEWAARLRWRRRAASRPAPERPAATDELRKLETRAHARRTTSGASRKRTPRAGASSEVTETELIRTKARLKGLETKRRRRPPSPRRASCCRRAEGAPALGRDRSRPGVLGKAEDQLKKDNFGAAIFFAAKGAGLRGLQGQRARARPPTRRHRGAGPPPRRAASSRPSDRRNLRESPTTQRPPCWRPSPRARTLDALRGPRRLDEGPAGRPSSAGSLTRLRRVAPSSTSHGVHVGRRLLRDDRELDSGRCPDRPPLPVPRAGSALRRRELEQARTRTDRGHVPAGQGVGPTARDGYQSEPLPSWRSEGRSRRSVTAPGPGLGMRSSRS
jgi:hypothetical protein